MGIWLRNINSKSRRRSRRPAPLYSDPHQNPELKAVVKKTEKTTIKTSGPVGINPPGFQPNAILDVTGAIAEAHKTIDDMLIDKSSETGTEEVK
jgi:hypothetical protein